MNIQHLSQRTTCWPLVIVSSAHSSLSPALSHSVLSYRSPRSPIQRILSIIKVLHHCYITTRHMTIYSTKQATERCIGRDTIMVRFYYHLLLK